MKSTSNDEKEKLTELTPKYMRCCISACPSIFETVDDSYMVIGKKIKLNDLPEKIRNKIGSDETIIEVPKDLLDFKEK